ncbi:hypothetical protein JL720_12449 [Aureococcus anophagefferens]|nr:hypothetical protein JL720_12449 [Aureococcus anophagefferens]
MILDCIEMGPPSSPVPAPPPASADAAAVRAYATTLKDLGNDRFAAGDDDSASALYGKALDAYGSMGDLRCAALCNRAACHLRAKRWRACVADCDAALALDGAQGALPRAAPRASGTRARPGTTSVSRPRASAQGRDGARAQGALPLRDAAPLTPRRRPRASVRAAASAPPAAPPSRPAPAPGDLAEDFDAFSVRVRLAVSSLGDAVALVGPSGPEPNLQSDCSVRVFDHLDASACGLCGELDGRNALVPKRATPTSVRPSSSSSVVGTPNQRLISAQVGPRVGGLVRARRRLRAVATPAPARRPRRGSVADARAARRRPFHAAGARPLEAGAHRLVVSRRGEELAAAAFDVPPPPPRRCPGRGSAPRAPRSSAGSTAAARRGRAVGAGVKWGVNVWLGAAKG